MPLEGHWQRQHATLRATSRRERVLLFVLAAAVALSLAAAIILSSARSGTSAAARGCIDVTVPSTTGGASIHGCGEVARRYCLGEDPIPADVVAAVHGACRRAGLPIG